MKNAYIISTGTELLSGTTVDSNSVFLSQRLSELGIKIIGKITVGDDYEQLTRAFNAAAESADIIISTGGLGPTFDDLTKEVVCEIMDCSLELRDEEERNLRAYFANRNRTMPEINLRQAMFPKESVVLKNSLGTAPGMYLNKKERIVILLPGPPREMRNMYINEAEPLIRKDFESYINKVIKKTIKVIGPGESQVEERLGDLVTDHRGCSMALLAVDGEIHIRLEADIEEKDGSYKLEYLTEKIAERMGRNIFAYDDETLVSKVGRLLVSSGGKLAVCESCTGGLLGKLLTDLPGSSRYFWGGVTSYSNEAKQRILGVNENTLGRYGAVSKETAREMAQGILNLSRADFGISITGIAGPEGGSPDKPVGLVYIALAYNEGCRVKELRFSGGRDAVRILSAKSALDLLRRHIEFKQ